MSISNKTIVVTRDSSQAKPFIKQLKNLDAKVIQFPVIKISAADDYDHILAVVSELDKFDWIIFTSTNAVKFFFQLVDKKQSVFQEIKIACVGKKTAGALKTFNLSPELIPEQYTALDLLKAMQKYDLNAKSVLIPVSNLAGPELEQELQKRGALVKQVVVYKNVAFKNPQRDSMYQKISDNLIDCITFFSPSALNSFIDQMSDNVVSIINANKISVAVIGRTTAFAAQKKNLQLVIQPEKSDIQSFIQALNEFF